MVSWMPRRKDTWNLARRADRQPECGRLGPTFRAYGPVAAPADWLVLPHDHRSDGRVASVTSLAHALVWSRPRQPMVSLPAPRGQTATKELAA